MSQLDRRVAAGGAAPQAIPAAGAVCEVRQLGLIDHQQAHELQERLAVEIASRRRPATLLMLEHPHTYTFGRRGKSENVLWGAAELKARGVELVWTDRGGDVTYHGPGQLVGYPLLSLGAIDAAGRVPQADFVGYLRRLEMVLIRAVATLGLAAAQRPGLTGVWVQPDIASRCPHCPPAARETPSKLASIGVKIDAGGITRHGFALNVAPDMRYWDGIVACDLPATPMVSLADLLEPAPTIERASSAVVEQFGAVFGYTMRPYAPQ